MSSRITLQQYLAARARSVITPLQARPICGACKRVRETCYCTLVRRFDSGAKFLVLTHPQEARNRVGTARMVGLSVVDSVLFEGRGEQLDRNPRLRAMLDDPGFAPVVLYPGRQALDLDGASAKADVERLRDGRRLAILVIDGTWTQAKRMLQRSEVLRALPQIAFRPAQPSRYIIREQPHEICVSTVEAVHALIDRLAVLGTYPAPADRAHDGMIALFDHMVAQQIDFEKRRMAAGASLRGDRTSVSSAP